MARLTGFTARMGIIGDAVETSATKLKRGAALQCLTGVVLATPVDTGRARGNWLVGLNFPVEAEAESEDRGGGSTIAAGNADIARARAVDDIWLSNNLPYITKLNEGSSFQAPVGFVEDVVDAVRDWLHIEGENFLKGV